MSARKAVKTPKALPPANSIESFTGKKRVRRSFGRIEEVAQMPNLIEVQRQSYELFLQAGITAEDREVRGLEEVFSSVFPIKDFSDKAEMFLKCTAHLVCSSITMVVKATYQESISSLRALFLTADHGWTLSLMEKTTCMCVLTVVVNCL